MRNQNGFTLMELMVVVAIIGIISAIALPSYTKNVQKTARGEGMTEILNIMRSQENYFANEFTYTTTLTELNMTASYTTQSGRYKVKATACPGLALTLCVLLTGTAINGQVGDGNLTLDSRGNRTRNGTPGWTK